MSQPRPSTGIEPGLLALIGLGGALGAVLRYGMQTWLPAGEAPSFPWATFTVNVAGAFGLGVLHAYVPAHPRLPRRVRAVLGAGLLGGFTTFSTYAVQTRDLLAGGHDLLALTYVLGTPVAAVLAVAAGRWVVPGRPR